MNQNLQSHLGIGIDTARYGHHASFMDEQKRTASKGFHFSENADGYEKLRKTIEQLIAKHPQALLHIHVDAAGQYAENLIQWLHQQSWTVVISVGQPARNKAYRKAHYDKRKADPIESLACARFAVVERPPAMHRPAVEFSALRDAVAQMESSASARTALVNQLHNMLARAFPELATLVADIASVSILKLLEKYPTAERLAAARLETLCKLPHINSELAAKLLQAAKSSTASLQNETSELLIKQKVQAIVAERKNQADIGEIVQNAVKNLPDGPHRRIRTICGIGLQTEAALIAKIINIERFRSANALIGYFGIFPEEVDVSGVNKDGTPKTGRAVKMSRKGNDLVRRLLYTATQNAVRFNPPIRALFARLMANGKDYKTAIGHCMAKLLRQVFGVWTTDCDYDPEYESRNQASKEQLAEEGAKPAQEETKSVAGHSQEQVPSRKVVTTTASSITAKRRPLNFAKLREQVSMSQVLELLDWTPTRNSGGTLRGCCPMKCTEAKNDSSFAVNEAQKAFCCHRCGAQGNALDLWATSQNLTLFDATWDLIERLRLDPPLLQTEKENCLV
ncbi:MAG: transposase [Aureliella sp.]